MPDQIPIVKPRAKMQGIDDLLKSGLDSYQTDGGQMAFDTSDHGDNKAALDSIITMLGHVVDIDKQQKTPKSMNDIDIRAILGY